MKNLEIKTIVHGGVTVTVKIDYDKGTVSLVENMGMGNYLPKKWCFADRQVEFMAGWLKILDAITVAVKEAKKDLDQDIARKKKAKEEKILGVIIKKAKK